MTVAFGTSTPTSITVVATSTSRSPARKSSMTDAFSAAVTRIGENSKVVLTHDVAQRDNLRVGRYDGIGAVVDHLRGHPLFGHITLTRSERSPVAALVAGLLDGHG